VAAVFSGPFPATITGSTYTEILVSGTVFSGGVTNAGTINGAGIVVVSSTLLLPGGLVNTNRISGSQRPPPAAR
jgi:hypothetical protein